MSFKIKNLFGKYIWEGKKPMPPLEEKKRHIIAYYCRAKDIRLQFKRYVKVARYLVETWEVDLIEYVIDWLKERGELFSILKVEETLERFYKNDKKTNEKQKTKKITK